MENVIDFFADTQTTISVLDVLMNLFLSIIMAFLIKTVFVYFAISVSNRKIFGNIFLLVTVCTSLIISIIQSSIALSLGLVGALSIVRFRTAIKEPEELVYLFLCIAIGLGFGANERLLTLVAGVFILLILVFRGMKNKKNLFSETYNVDIVSSNLSLDEVINNLSPYCESYGLKRFSSDESHNNICLQVDFLNIQKLELAISELRELDQEIKISFLPNSVLS